MKNKFFKNTVKWTQVAVLAGLFLFAWSLAAVLRFNFNKGDEDKKAGKFSALFTSQRASADVGGGATAGGCASACITSTPFLAVWNGIRYVLENDFLFGKPRSYFSNFSEGLREYARGGIAPDLYKIQSTFRSLHGALRFQIHEIEPEESYINWLKLVRLVYPAGSQVFVNSTYKKFYAFSREVLEKNYVAARWVVDGLGNTVRGLADIRNVWREDVSTEVPLKKNNHFHVSFSGLNRGKEHFLLVKSRSRTWVMGDQQERSASFLAQQYVSRLFSNSLVRSGSALISGLFLVLGIAKLLPFLATGFIPLFRLSGCGEGEGAGGGGGGECSCSCSAGCGNSAGGGGDGGKCLLVYNKDDKGNYVYLETVEPRAWRYSSEVVSIPKEAISESGELELRVSATENHVMGFIGLFRETEQVGFTTEYLPLTRAYHTRLGKDVTRELMSEDPKELVHTIPGDVVDLEFAPPRNPKTEGREETYLLQSSGFYTCLSPESKAIAGNWMGKIMPEARERLEAIYAGAEFN